MTQTLTEDEQAQVRAGVAQLDDQPYTVEQIRRELAAAGRIAANGLVYLPEVRPASKQEAFDAAFSEPPGPRKAAYLALGVLWPLGVRSHRVALAIALYVTASGTAVVGGLLGL